MDYILAAFPLSNSEYNQLEAQFGDLAHYAAWQLIQKNVKNNHTDDQEDIAQEIRWASVKAGSYFKRQVYIESCLQAVKEHAVDKKSINILNELENLWNNRTKHGANKQKFGKPEETLLDALVDKVVPEEHRPSKSPPLEFNAKFITYCKAIIWNCQKSLGKKITREKTIRSGIVSLSEYDYLVSSNGQISILN